MNTTSAPFDTRHRQEMMAAGLLVILEPANNTTIRLHYPEGDQDDLDVCRLAMGDMGPHGGQAWFLYTIWNRTGVTHYFEMPVPASDIGTPFFVDVALPPDPPFIVKAAACTMDPVVEFYANDWFYEAINGQRGIGTSATPFVNITVPTGQVTGRAAFTLEYPFYYVEIGPLPGAFTTPEGNRYGDYWFRSPSQEGEEWLYHGWLHPTETSWELQRVVTHSEPGDYEIEVQLMAPSVGDTRWMTDLWVFEFTDNLADFGFKVPLVSHL